MFSFAVQIGGHHPHLLVVGMHPSIVESLEFLTGFICASSIISDLDNPLILMRDCMTVENPILEILWFKYENIAYSRKSYCLGVGCLSY